MRTPRSPSRPGRSPLPSPVNSYNSALSLSPSTMSNPPPLAPLESGSSSLAATPPELPAYVDRKAEAEQRALNTVEDAIAAIRARAGLTTVAQAADPLLYLPPLLSRLPAGTAPAPSPVVKEATIDYTSSHLPRIDSTSLALHRALHVFRPVTSLYAVAPYPSSFNWSDIVLEDDPTGSVGGQEREWYIVAFRSKRREGFTPEEALDLYGADRDAHEEAVQVSFECSHLSCVLARELTSSAPSAEGCCCTGSAPRFLPKPTLRTTRKLSPGRRISPVVTSRRASGNLAPMRSARCAENGTSGQPNSRV